MNSNNYQALKDFIASKLKKIEGPLPKDKIYQEIDDTNKLIGILGDTNTAKLLSIESFELPEEEDWTRMIRELETHFDVKMDHGILIQGDEQKDRDTSWWTSVYKQRSKNYYWMRFRSYLEESLPPEVIKTLDTDTDIVMNNLENPGFSGFSRYGMVVGHVQSGKTGNYSALVCKAADAGYKFIVIISGDKNNLRNQTQERLNESFIGQTKGTQVGAGKGNSIKDLLPYSLTTIERDFNKQDADKLAQGLNFDNVSVPILLVIKKNTNTLNNVIDWLQKQYVNKVTNHAMLVIDDESDYASINTKENEDPTAINKKLRTLISLFSKSAYVAYTATPYANIFIDHQVETADLGRDLFPKDFIYALDAPSNYFGARRIFIDSDNAHLVPINDWFDDLPPNHKKDFKIAQLPPSLLDAIRLFLMVIAIRNLRGQGDKHNSMLIHATRFTDVHKLLGKLAEDYLDRIKNDVSVYGKLKNSIKQSALLNQMKETFDAHYADLEFKWDKVIGRLAEVIDNVVVREVHQSTSVPLEYRKDVPTNAIVIGGTSLSRGFTLEGLSVSYFLRNTVFYDTLMQMGRWFGYRSGYEDLCRIYMPADRIADFAEIIRATEELFRDFKIMADNNMTPNDFGLAVQQNPDSILQVTARNKQKNVHEFIHSMRLDGKLKETSYLRKNDGDIHENIETLKELLDKLGEESEKIAGSYVWRKVSKEKVIPFLKNYKTFDNDRLGLTSRMPIAFIEQFAIDRDILWDIALYSGEGDDFIHGRLVIAKEKRMFNIEETYIELQNRQVSSGSAEAVGLEDADLRKKLSNNRGETRRNLSRPLLMLHVLQQSSKDLQIGNPINEIVAFGVSFPGSVASKTDTITLKINTVYYQNLLKQLADEEGSDD